MPYFTYIISNYTHSTIYTGVTNNLERRLYEHKHGLLDNSFSKQYKLYKLLWFQEFSDVNDAITAEKKVKGWSRKKKIDLIKELNPGMKDIGAASA